MPGTANASVGRRRRLRADARRNRERIVTAAIELFIEQGVEVPLDAIAKRAEVGIGTLYRRFPDREAVAQAVATASFATVTELARDAMQGDGALRRFLADIAEARIGVLMASLLPLLTQLPHSDDLADSFDDMVASVNAVVIRAHETGELRDDVTADDVMLLLAMLTRPLEGIPAEYAAAITPRLLHLLVEGLQPSRQATAPPSTPPRPEDPLSWAQGAARR